MKRYLFQLNNTYNNEKPFYEIDSLPNSDVVKVYIFGGRSDFAPNGMGSIYIYLELRDELTPRNVFYNLQRILNLIYLETGSSTYYREIPLNGLSNFDEIYTTFGASKYFDGATSYHGITPEPNHILRVQQLITLINKVNENEFMKFDNSLNTYVWALELRELPNPHLKFTLYMTLLLSSIEQLSSSPSNCDFHDPCPKCQRELSHHVKGQGQRQALENLIRHLLTGAGVEDGVKRVSLLYGKLRSSFLHSGNLYGGEKDGGFLEGVENDTELLEDELNIILLVRKLLEQFLVKGSQ